MSASRQNMENTPEEFQLYIKIHFEKLPTIEHEIYLAIDQNLNLDWGPSQTDGRQVLISTWKKNIFLEFEPEKPFTSTTERKAFENKCYQDAVEKIKSELLVLLDFY